MSRSRFTRRRFLQTSLLAAGSPWAMSFAGAQANDDERPNILWLTCEDIGPHLGCYGDPYAHTPNLDAFAEMALRYEVCWSDAPVCSPARTALITGMYPPAFGAHNHRSMVGMPDFVRLYPEFLREAGYYCTNNGKEDYNVRKPDGVWDESSNQAHYTEREEGQPFFAVFNNGQSHGSRIRNRTDLPHHDPDEAPLPPYHPDTEEFRRDWAQYYHAITNMDEWFGAMMDEVRENGRLDDTIIFFYGDHGSGMPRNKQLAYDSGLHVPLLVYVPEKYRHLAPADYEPGGTTDRLVGFVDMGPTALSLAGVEPPDWMHGRAFMGPHETAPREYLFGFRGRMDERQDMVRSVRGGRYIYIRNYMPHLKHGHFSSYMYTFESTRAWRRLHEEGALEGPETHVFEPKPAEELYDLHEDPHEITNLVDSEAHQAVLAELRAAHQGHMRETRDLAFLPEAEMHRRAKGTTAPIWEIDEGVSLYEMGQDPDQYPFESIFAMAELAAARSAEAVPALILGTGHGDPAIRYWATMGVLIRGAEAFEAAAPEVRQAIDDESPSVRVVAAETLVRYGGENDRSKGLDALAELAQPDVHGVYVTFEALNAFGNLGPKAEAIEERLNENADTDPDAPQRGANEYIVRLRPDTNHEGVQWLRQLW
ncbi:MAG: sulfatase-like hydrolase/transferase [Candidatus Hydrogenedentota bacterium]